VKLQEVGNGHGINKVTSEQVVTQVILSNLHAKGSWWIQHLQLDREIQKMLTLHHAIAQSGWESQNALSDRVSLSYVPTLQPRDVTDDLVTEHQRPSSSAGAKTRLPPTSTKRMSLTPHMALLLAPCAWEVRPAFLCPSGVSRAHPRQAELTLYTAPNLTL
jgi:hypothetical protein